MELLSVPSPVAAPGELLAAFPNGWSHIMLRAYIDDSGSDLLSPRFVLAGLISTETIWTGFEKEWASRLKKWNLPYFKASEANSRNGPFEGWSRERRDECVLELLSLITRSVLVGTSVAVRREDLNDAFADVQRPPWMRTPYSFLMLGLLERFKLIVPELNKVAALVPEFGEKVACFFDMQDGAGAAVLDFATYRGEYEYVHSVVHASSATFLPLQAADMLAWASNRWLRGPEAPPPGSFEALKRSSIAPLEFDRAWLIELAARIRMRYGDN